ncbi:FxSxx-COOH system tetratricopeptide repeat protein [Dictyobacter arantiisoli]|uniref:Tetratricopeptide repeat protein n=1 Tax=Dictyobacter arantiisoli TaxID=2014874 RepID=A0A5A5T858_9CHLR|nr:FxSxx-COOH system tetratricopeptide repeat protein [Dictyobacter arantiisoli]GCF07588.1 tetratricopeptide repeat protein [Dictyobacter arantiisoli]
MSISPPSAAIKVFISYARVTEDEVLLKKLLTHLKPLALSGKIEFWQPLNILAGEDKNKEIAEHLNQAQIILLLISSDFISSDSQYGFDLTRAMERRAEHTAHVISVLLRPTYLDGEKVGDLQALPQNGKPVTKWPDLDDAFVDIVNGIARVVEEQKKVVLEQARTIQEPFHKLNNIPFERNRLFTGREAYLADLHTALREAQTAALTQAISGLGGIGKTQTALEYAYRYQHEYEQILWLTADTRDTVLSGLSRIAPILKLPVPQESEQTVIVQAVLRWLEAHEHWLLILDNVENLADIKDLPPQHARGHTLITTRSQIVSRRARHLDLAIMDATEGATLLLRRAEIIEQRQELSQATLEDQEAASKIVTELGGLPLALDQAGAYISETGCGLERYRQLYQQKRLTLLKRKSSTDPGDYHDTVATTWSLSFDRVQQANPASVELLYLCALLEPDEIPEELFSKGATKLGPVLSTLCSDDFEFNELMIPLRNYSLIRRNPNQILSIHRLVQVVLQERMAERNLRKIWEERAIDALALSIPPADYEQDHWARCLTYLPQIQHAIELLGARPTPSDINVQLWHWYGNVLDKQARYQAAETAYLQALTLSEDVLGKIHPVTARILNDLAEVSRLQAHFQQAEQYNQHALTMRETLFDTEHAETATSLNNLARSYQEQAKYHDAEPLYQRALKIKEAIFGPEHAETASSLNDLATLYDAQGKYSQAEVLDKRALAIREKVLDSQHPDVALSLDNLAGSYKSRGKYEEAEPLYKRALKIREQALGGQHPDTATSLGNLAGLYQRLGKYEEAEPLYKRALKIREQALGGQHPDTATSLNNLAGLYQSQGKYEEAEPLYKRALKISEQVLGGQHPDTATSLGSLAGLYESQGKYEEAEPLYKRALEIREQALGGQHPYTATSLGNLAGLYESQGKYEEAEPLYKRALEIREQALGGQHPDTATSLNNLAVLYRSQGKIKEAMSLSRRALEIREKTLGPQHPDTANSLHNLGMLYVDQRFYSLAGPLLKRSLAIYEQVLSAQHPDTILVRKHYMELRALMRPVGKGSSAKKKKNGKK